MRTTHRRLAATAAVATAAGLLSAAPAGAGGTWGPQQEITSKTGRAIGLSDSGRVAAWIRTGGSDSPGQVRTAWYQGAKKGWSPSSPIGGTAATQTLTLSADGNTAFTEVEGTGYLLAQRKSKNTWGKAGVIIPGTFLAGGRMSADATTFAWVDWVTGPGASPHPAGALKTTTRKADGTFTPAITVGDVTGSAFSDPSEIIPVWLSPDGSTVVWLAQDYGLRATVKQADGSWSPSALLKQYTESPRFEDVQMSDKGTRIIWREGYGAEGVLTIGRSGTTWGLIDYVTTDDAGSAGLSPSGKVAAYCTDDKSLMVSKWDAGWTKGKSIGKCSNYPPILVRNKTIAWTYNGFFSPLRASILRKGKWQTSGKFTSSASEPALTRDGGTLAWYSPEDKSVYSVKR